MKAGIIFFIAFICLELSGQKLPEGFSYLSEIDTTIQKELRYLSSNNFIGKPIDGYLKNKVIISSQAAIALKKVQEELLYIGKSLIVFDAYRPQQSVDHYVRLSLIHISEPTRPS